MKKTVLSALTAAFVLGVIAPQVSAAPVSAARPDSDSQVNEELRDLRARVAMLERENDYRNSYNYDDEDDWTKKFDLKGEFRYRFWHNKKASDKTSNNRLELRFIPTIQLNDNLAIKSRFAARYNHMEHDHDSDWSTHYLYLEGKFDKFQVNAGKLVLFTDVDQGMVADNYFSGVQFITDVGDFNLKINGGRIGDSVDSIVRIDTDGEARVKTVWSDTDYIGAEALYDMADEFRIGAGYHHLQNGDAKANIFTLGGEYELNNDWTLNAAYGHNNKGGSHKDAFNVQGNYLGAQRDEEGTWGAYVAYRHVPDTVGIFPTYDTFNTDDKKGFEFGGEYTPMKDTLLQLQYFHGKHFNKNNARTLFARASIFF